MLILRQMDYCLHLGRRQFFIEKDGLYACGQKIEQNALQLSRVDGSSIGRKACGQTDMKTAVRWIQGHRGTLQDFLPAPAHGNQTALSGSLCLKGIFLYFLIKKPIQIILQSNAAMLFQIIFQRKSRLCPADENTETGRGSEGISLYMIDSQHIGSEGICPLQIFIGWIAFTVDCMEHATKFFRCFHSGFNPFSSK